MTATARQAWTLVGLLVVGAYAGALGYLMQHEGYDVWGALIIGPILILISLPVLGAISRGSNDEWLFRLLVAALVVKLLASLARYWTAFVLYDGVADAAGYHGVGSRLADSYRLGVFDAALGSGGEGTQFIQMLTGGIYAITGASLVGGYLIYSWIGFWGLVLCYLAFRQAVRDGHHRRYAVMLLFLPSLLFWPSGIGKEAWMTFGLGLCFFGISRLLTHQRWGFAWLASGLLATAAVRPHVTLLVAIALVAAYVVRPSRRLTALTPVVKVGGALVAAAVAIVVLRATASFLGVEEVSVGGFEAALEDAQERTDQGGSAFGGAALTSPLGLPWALVTVLFRPFPYEVDSVQAVLASLEGLLLMYLAWHFRRSLYAIPKQLRSSPYMTFCLTYVLGYVAVFAGFSNFGILVRQRSLALPAFLVLLALPEIVRRTTQRPAVPHDLVEVRT